MIFLLPHLVFRHQLKEEKARKVSILVEETLPSFSDCVQCMSLFSSWKYRFFLFHLVASLVTASHVVYLPFASRWHHGSRVFVCGIPRNGESRSIPECNRDWLYAVQCQTNREAGLLFVCTPWHGRNISSILFTWIFLVHFSATKLCTVLVFHRERAHSVAWRYVAYTLLHSGNVGTVSVSLNANPNDQTLRLLACLTAQWRSKLF